MPFWERLLSIGAAEPARTVLDDTREPFWGTAGIPVMDPGVPVEVFVGPQYGADGDGSSFSNVEKLWRTQPHLRKTVDFIARNVASTPLNVFDRVNDVERRRISTGPLSHVLKNPRPRVSSFRFWHAVISDMLLYDRWCVLVDATDPERPVLTHIPSGSLTFDVDSVGLVTRIGRRVRRSDGSHGFIPVDLDAAIYDHGYAPGGRPGQSPIVTLQDILDENTESVKWRRDIWRNGARLPGFITRPVDAPAWSPELRSRFVTAIREWSNGKARAGSLPLLEDGMEIKESRVFSPRDALDVEGRQASAIEVATAFHIAPELLGIRQGTYANMDAYRQMLWGPSLGPYVSAIEGVLNSQLVPILTNSPTTYIEANVEAKLRGSFIEQAEIMQRATGGPWMTRNEVRAMQNRAPIDGADDLIVPLNVTAGGQASPNAVMPPKAVNDVDVKAPEQVDVAAKSVEETLVGFFTRQEAVVLSALGAGTANWWDSKRWDTELADDLFPVLVAITTTAAVDVLTAAGFPAGAYSAAAAVTYLRERARRTAAAVNDTTRTAVAAADAADDGKPADVFTDARGSRAEKVGAAVANSARGFAAHEAAAQAGAKTKTWVTGKNPRPAHTAMDGETVPVGAVFSNGLRFPGESGPVEETAGCNCSLKINF